MVDKDSFSGFAPLQPQVRVLLDGGLRVLCATPHGEHPVKLPRGAPYETPHGEGVSTELPHFKGPFSWPHSAAEGPGPLLSQAPRRVGHKAASSPQGTNPPACPQCQTFQGLEELKLRLFSPKLKCKLTEAFERSSSQAEGLVGASWGLGPPIGLYAGVPWGTQSGCP